MKKIVGILLFLNSLTFFANAGINQIKLQNTFPDTLKVIMSIKHDDRNISNTVRTHLNSMSGINVLAYCDNHAVFMFYIDKNVYRDLKDFITEFKKLYAKTEDLISFKEGDFNAFTKYCNPSNPDDAGNLKKLATN